MEQTSRTALPRRLGPIEALVPGKLSDCSRPIHQLKSARNEARHALQDAWLGGGSRQPMVFSTDTIQGKKTCRKGPI